MKKDELRIGNNTKQGKVIELRENSARIEYFTTHKRTSLIFYSSLEPIELTPDIMKKIKGIKQKEGSLGLYYYIEPFSVLRFFFDGTQLVIIKKENGNIWIANKKYLHEFQNLYFALTNEELEIDLG
ncbi:hypothetical protein [Flavobacterium sp. I3-2]|uniref:hypothetical protein n=1 Tax=Flavobacterium sp. I3-2 TaxID=2748319 RepID=UPI0015AE1FFE|nr:hypothetical protein [Flavobacterium sp. I3-2]